MAVAWVWFLPLFVLFLQTIQVRPRYSATCQSARFSENELWRIKEGGPVSQKQVPQLRSPNLTYKCSTMSQGNPVILGQR